MTSLNFDAFVRGYTAALLWSTTYNSIAGSPDDRGLEEGDPIDNAYTADDIDPEDRDALLADCRAFATQHAALLAQAVDRVGYTSERAGHDFWLTREGHGAGYWDRPELADGGLGDQLTTAAQAFGAHSEGGPWVEDGVVRYGRGKSSAAAAPATAEATRRPKP